MCCATGNRSSRCSLRRSPAPATVFTAAKTLSCYYESSICYTKSASPSKAPDRRSKAKPRHPSHSVSRSGCKPNYLRKIQFPKFAASCRKFFYYLSSRSHNHFIDAIQIFGRIIFNLDLPSPPGTFMDLDLGPEPFRHRLDRRLDVRVHLNLLGGLRLASLGHALGHAFRLPDVPALGCSPLCHFAL